MREPFSRFGLSAEPGSDEFWNAVHGPVPVPDSDGWSTLFLWRGSPATLWFESWSDTIKLRQWEDSDCWYAEVPMPARLRVTYQYRTDDGHDADPLNPAAAGIDRSIFATPDAQEQPHWPVVGPDDVLPLPRTRIRWISTLFGGRRTVRVHQPDGAGPHPTVLLLDGDDWMHVHPAMTAFESAVTAGEMPPATLVFLPTPNSREAEFACNPTLWKAIRDELMPLLSENGVAIDREKLVVAGQSYGGLSAFYAALEFPDLVSRVACQSGSFWWRANRQDDSFDGPLGGDIAERLTKVDLSRLRVAFDVGEHETEMLPHCELVEKLTEEAGATVRVSRSTSAHDRAGWRHPLVRDVAWALRD
ncbi:enterochelin esterase family protein [Herbihabitans rhizosphaerae]|uniref:Enterochelin esterase family protein n=1 Tax=Herbihabitans rhizosphaerae TaxID=1872711 RepID=A0A4Q7L0W2_9PSEU|nr:alpha/beta hydrolase-fold protein [Herbihabitans rhizosphaerae]RZS43118.1 enterochelin esterase family protein [Herbihabitans rhizosphaerae]